MRGSLPGLVAILLTCVASVAQGVTIEVPTDSPTIQGGISSAVAGDTVLVYPGTYVENIDFLGKAVVLLSASGPDSTVIDGNQAGSVVTFVGGEGSDSVIEGFTITNGSGTYVDDYWEYGGGGIFCNGSGPTIRHNKITGNAVNNGGGIGAILSSAPVITHNRIFGNSANPSPGHIGGGGGIVAGWSSTPLISHNVVYDNQSGVAGGGMAFGFECDPVVRNNTIRDNVANVYGGGIQIYSNTIGTFESNIVMRNESYGDKGAGGISCRVGSSPTIRNNLICGNAAATYGGGMRCFNEATPTITNNIVFDNQAGISGGGLECDTGASAAVTNMILWGNVAPEGTEIWVGPRGGAQATLSIAYSDVEGGMASVHVEPGSTLDWGLGMLDVDPLFRDASAQDFHLKAIDCGDLVDSDCIDAGDPAVMDSLLDCSHGLGAPRSDIGAYGGLGGGPVTSVLEEPPGVPRVVRLLQNYPNPFNPTTRVRFELLKKADVALEVYDVSGRLIRALVDDEYPAGGHETAWDGRDGSGHRAATGVYFCRLRSGELEEVRKMVLVK